VRGETRQPADQAGWETLHPAGASSAANRRLLSRALEAFPAYDEYQKALEEITHLRQVHANSQADKDVTIEKLLRGDSLSRHKKEPPAANMLQRVNTGNKPKPLSLGEVQTARRAK
jgi:hypothetical protein